MFQKKSLGQNFLKNRAVVRAMITAAHIESTDVVLEAGPGKGILTEALLATGAHVVAVEKDNRLIPLLREKFSTELVSGKLVLAEGDILSFPTERYTLHATRYKLVANIPYYITGAFLKKFLEDGPQPSTMALLVQKEVATRILARNGKESILSISVKAFGTPKILRTVRASEFSPVPKVDSAVLFIENISKNFFADLDEKIFFKILKAGFAHKRKLLAGNLSVLFPKEKIAAAFETCGIPEKSRAEDIIKEQWFALTKQLNRA